jgi:hypothetical protein
MELFREKKYVQDVFAAIKSPAPYRATKTCIRFAGFFNFYKTIEVVSADYLKWQQPLLFYLLAGRFYEENFYFQQVNSLNPQKIINPPIMMSQIFEGRRKAQRVTMPMIKRIKPNSSISPGFRQQIFFLCFIVITSYDFLTGYCKRFQNLLPLSTKYATANNSATNIIYHIYIGTVCMIITAPIIANTTPESRSTIICLLFIATTHNYSMLSFKLRC